MSDSDDEMPDQMARLDQLLAGLRVRAQILHSFYSNLCELGFNADDALDLVRDYQEYLRP